MTAQTREIMYYEGQQFGMASEPFNQYFLKSGIDFQPEFTSTACYRGYVGEWEIADNKLYLIKIDGSGYILDKDRFREGKLALRKQLKEGLISPKQNGHLLKELKKTCTDEVSFTKETFFPGEEKVFAEWFSGIIRIPFGEMLKYVHDGYASVFENNLILEFKEGILTGRQTVGSQI